MSASEIEDFLNGPLVSWLESCLPRPEILSGYTSLLDGAIINSVVLQIDPEPQHHLVKLIGLDGVLLANARARNFDAIVRNLRNLYEEELCQRVLILPDCSVLGHSPETPQGLEQMKLLLILLLGAAVQCPNKELFIGRIKELDLETQHAIVELIKQVTDNQSLVLTNESMEQLTPDMMYNHLLRVTKERDQYHSNWITSFTIETEVAHNNGPQRINSMSPSSAATTNGPDSNHMVVELADLKSKLRKLRQELEEKSEAFMEVKEELEHKTSQYEKLRTESQEWYTEARRSSAYRDEVDVLRERAERADRLEVEVQKLREKLSDAEFYKTRVEELREDNRTLLETKEMLEEQLQRARKRSDHAMVLESEIIKYQQKLNDMALERDVDKNKLQELVDENTQLQLATKNLTALSDLNQETSDLEEESVSADNSLSGQLTNNAQTRALRLELENRRLLATLDAMKESSFHESSNKILELEKEKKKLSLKVEQMQENCKRQVQQIQELEDVFKNALEENKKLQDSLDARQQANDRQVQEREADRMKIIDLETQIETLVKEKQRIQNLSDSIQRRADDVERLCDTKTRECESLSEKLVDFDKTRNQLDDLREKLNTMEKENINFTKEVVKLRESLEEKDKQLDRNSSEIESHRKEMQRLHGELAEKSVEVKRIAELEKQNNELISQGKIDAETIATLQRDLVNGALVSNKVKQGLEKLGLDDTVLDNSDFNVENVVEKLVKNPETFRTVKEFMLHVGKETTSSDMCVLCHRKEIFTVEKEIEINNDCEVDLINQTEEVVSSVSAQWKKQCDHLYTENSNLKALNEQLEGENARQKVALATSESQMGSLNSQYVALQVTNSQLTAEKESLMKQMDIYKQRNESLRHDLMSLQSMLEQSNSEYESSRCENKDLKTTIRDLKAENRDLRERLFALEKDMKELEAESKSTKSDTMNLTNLRAEHSKLKEDFRNLFTQNDRMKQQYKTMQEQYRSMRNENGRLMLQNTELKGELSSRSDHATGLEIELAKVQQQCDMLVKANSDLDTDRQKLMDNVSQLLSQYHELIVMSQQDRQHYHEEEKCYTDKLNSLYRQKEQLEEKIMDYFKKMDNCAPKKKPFGSNLVKRVKKAGTDIMNRVPNRFQYRKSWIDDSRLTQSQLIMGSESGGNDSDNSTEEPNSVSSDTTLLSRYSNSRQSLQRKPSDNCRESPLTRGGVRSSLQTTSPRRDEVNRANRNSLHMLDGTSVGPDVTVAALGTAGSRRTVYLVDDGTKLPEATPSPSHSQSSAGGSSGANCSNSGDNGTHQSSGNPSTLLMYNRISNVIGGDVVSMGASSGNQMLNSGSDKANHRDNGKKRPPSEEKDKEPAIWYEYGCV
ncbi:girdin [Phlebotomus papatasi]|uniref:girdin n=1 Tax=Phlebotomus papatasi TaxID=29031 RepID=UPI002483DA4C|nr:girdin [Phlebotomus papatasi]XP_055701208.1 girdin [Phlebotomus papatasi]